jgi:hypothetical protein
MSNNILTKDMLKPGLRISNKKQFPYVKSFIIQRKYTDGIWELRGVDDFFRCIDIDLMECEVRFWELADQED